MDRTPHDPFQSEDIFFQNATHDDWDAVIDKLRERLGRLPTVDEVISFVHGDEWTQLVIWNKEKVNPRCQISSFTSAEKSETAR